MAVRVMRKGLGLALVVVCATSAPAAQQVQLPRRPRVIGIVRDPNGIPLPGVAVVTVLSPPSAPLVTFTGEDGRFALPKAVSDSAVIDVLHLAYGTSPLRVSELPRAPQDSTVAVADVRLRSVPIDTTPGAYAPPIIVTARSLPDAELELIERAARLPALRHVRQQGGDRQIRVYIHGGAGTPDHAAMLRRGRGRVTGEVWLWWILDPTFGLDPANARRGARSFGCPDAPWQWGTVLERGVPSWRAVLVCRATLSVTPDWQAMWRRLDSLDVWHLSDQTARLHNRRPFVRDGAMVTLEMLDGRKYRLIRHGHPDSSAAPGAARVAAIAQALQDAFTAVNYAPLRWIPPPVTYHISGTVRDTGGRPIAAALVTVPALPFSVRTSADGEFDVPYPVPFTASLGVEGPGYRTVRYTVFELPRPSYGPGSCVRTDIVLQVVADTTVDSVPPGYMRIRGFTRPPFAAEGAPPW